jgi:DNA-binding transcriptional MocR family regulator
MPDEKKEELVGLLARHEIPLIEDDVYGDLCFGSARPRVAKAYDEKGLVLLCSSFSKTLAPGYRIGWIVPGRFQQKVERLKVFEHATASPISQPSLVSC